MIKIKALCITIDYDPPNGIHNADLVGYVIQRYPRKVLKCSVVTRNSIDSWFEESSKKFDPAKHTFLIGTVCVLGQVTGISEVDQPGDARSYTSAKAPKDPSAN